jgi:hypothetical protein
MKAVTYTVRGEVKPAQVTTDLGPMRPLVTEVTVNVSPETLAVKTALSA